MNNKGLRGTKLYQHIGMSYENVDISETERKLRKVYWMKRRDIRIGLLEWLGTEATVQDLELQFNSHEIIELVQEDI